MRKCIVWKTTICKATWFELVTCERVENNRFLFTIKLLLVLISGYLEFIPWILIAFVKRFVFFLIVDPGSKNE